MLISDYKTKVMILGGPGLCDQVEAFLNENQQVRKSNNSDKAMDIQTESLRKLKNLHDSGVITDTEFSEKKKYVLGI